MKKPNWFKLMWMNGYIIGFIAGFALAIYMLIERKSIIAFSGTVSFYIALAIPVAICFIISWLGFYRFWKEIENFYDETP